jgi:hypothetical protein
MSPPEAGSARHTRVAARHAQIASPRASTARRSGAACVIAMMYVVLLSALSLGFFAATTMSAQVSGNEDRVFTARLAAESGMEFMRYQLAWSVIPAETHPTLLFEELYNQLKARLGATPNLGPNVVGLASGRISVPQGDENFIKLRADGPEFRADITDLGQRRVRVKVIGRARNGAPGFATQMDFATAWKPTKVFDYGLASRGPVTLANSARFYGTTNTSFGNMMLAHPTAGFPLTLDDFSAVSGAVAVTNASGTVRVRGSSTLVGSNDPGVWAQYVKKPEPAPDFPQPFTSDFQSYAGNPAYNGTVITVPNQTYSSFDLRNVLIKANTNPIFSGNIKVEGVIYVEAPNVVRFDSNVVVRGVIAVQDNPTGTPATNEIRFDGNAKLEGVEALPATADFPAELRSMTGSQILAPKFQVHFNGDFGTAAGSVIAGQLFFDTGAVGTVKGSLVSLENGTVRFLGSAAIGIESRPQSFPAAGMYFKQRFLPVADTYQEVAP